MRGATTRSRQIAPGLTARLWDGMLHPPVQHPLFWQVSLRTGPRYLRLARRARWPLAALIAALVLVAILANPAGAPMMLVLAFALPLVLILILPLSLPLVGGLLVFALALWWALRISGESARLRGTRAAEAMGATPDGPLGVHWALACGILHRGSLLDYFQLLVHLVTLVMGATWALTAALVVSVAFLGQAQPLTQGLATLLALLAGIYLFYTTCLQMAVLATVIGIGAESRLTAASAMLGVQVAAVLLLALGVVSAVLLTGGAPAQLPFALVVVLVMWHLGLEGVILWMTGRVFGGLNATPAELAGLRYPVPGEPTGGA
jgi:hypothetical protein